MNSKKVFYLMIGLMIVLGSLAIASVIVGNNMLQKESNKLVELKLENYLLEEQQTALIQANKNIEQYADLEKIAKSIVPQEKDQARTVREIVQFAAQSGIKLRTISFPSSTLGQAQPKPAAVSPDDKSGSSTPSAPAAPSVSQVKPVEGIPGVYSLEVTIQSIDNNAATYAGFLDFLNRLEQNRRTAQVTNISIKPSVTTDALSFTLTMNVYIKP